MEVMDTALANWSTILTTQSYKDVVEFQAAICYHEDSLMHLGGTGNPDRPDRWKDPSYQARRSRSESPKARVNLVGGELPPPRFPKDDSVISRKATPKSKGARPCRHCGSELHWDNECKHSRKGMRTARTRLAECSTEELKDQDDYDELYYGLSEGEDQDFA